MLESECDCIERAKPPAGTPKVTTEQSPSSIAALTGDGCHGPGPGSCCCGPGPGRRRRLPVQPQSSPGRPRRLAQWQLATVAEKRPQGAEVAGPAGPPAAPRRKRIEGRGPATGMPACSAVARPPAPSQGRHKHPAEVQGHMWGSSDRDADLEAPAPTPDGNRGRGSVPDSGKSGTRTVATGTGVPSPISASRGPEPRPRPPTNRGRGRGPGCPRPHC